jgi:hypothetical protein
VEGVMSMNCARCEGDLDHCHGTLVAHHDGLAECTDTRCAELDQARHDLLADCAGVFDGCHCVTTSEPELLSRAS